MATLRDHNEGRLARRLHRLVAMASASACAVVLSLSPGLVAYASDAAQWPAYVPGVQEAWKAGISGKGVKVAMIDTLPVSDNPGLKDAHVEYRTAAVEDGEGKAAECYYGDGVSGPSINGGTRIGEGDSSYQAWSSHGTDMLMALVGNGTSWDGRSGIRGVAPDSSMLFYTQGYNTAISPMVWCRIGEWDVNSQTGLTIEHATADGARIISMSFIGSVIPDYYDGYLDALRHGVVMVSGRANDTERGLDAMTGDPEITPYVPGVITVNSLAPNGGIEPASDTVDGNVAILSPSSNVYISKYDSRELSVGWGGNSTAAAVLSGYLSLAMQKWPDATGNQIMQSLVRNTKEGKGTATLDPAGKRGFGQVDVAALLSVDPSQYPDINPILEMQMLTAADSPTTKTWYTQDCAEASAVSTDKRTIPCQANEFLKEYERQKAAWAKVKQCRADGGSDCMRYSATATADGETPSDERGSNGAATADGRAATPVWLPWTIGAAGLLAVVTVITVVVLTIRRRRANLARRHGVMPVARPAPGRATISAVHAYPQPGTASAQPGMPHGRPPLPASSAPVPTPPAPHRPVPLPPEEIEHGRHRAR